VQGVERGASSLDSVWRSGARGRRDASRLVDRHLRLDGLNPSRPWSVP
jgi:hypothetical protein